MDFLKVLEDALVVGVPLLVIVVAVVNAAKLRFGWVGETARAWAIGIASAGGFGYLLAAVPLLDWSFPAFLAPFFLRLFFAVAWAALGPLGYDLLKNAAASGVADHNEAVEIAAVMGAIDQGLIDPADFAKAFNLLDELPDED